MVSGITVDSLPPSIGTIAPVMKDEASDARNTMALDTSSGCPILPSGWEVAQLAMIWNQSKYLWQSPRGKRAVSHWASLLRWIWSISEYPWILLGGITHHKPWPQNMCHTHSWPQQYSSIEVDLCKRWGLSLPAPFKYWPKLFLAAAWLKVQLGS